MKIHADLVSDQDPCDSCFLLHADVENVLSDLKPATEDEVHKIIMNSPSKSCSLDPIPTWLLKCCINELLPIITSVINLSLSGGEMLETSRKG